MILLIGIVVTADDDTSLEEKLIDFVIIGVVDGCAVTGVVDTLSV